MKKNKSASMMRPDMEWLPDDSVDTCMARRCTKKFNLISGKHHCRWCGKIFCDKCAPLVPLPPYGAPLVKLGMKEARKCNSCRLPAIFIPRRHDKHSKLDATPIEIILSFLDMRATNALLQSCSTMHRHFNVSDIKYFETTQDRFPSLFAGAKVGKGGCGTVFTVEDRNNKDEKVAVKIVDKKSIFSWQTWKKLLAEIEIMQGNNHVNVARLLEVFQTPNELVMVIELGEGGSLKRAYEVIKKKQYSMEVFTAHVVAQVSAALDYMFTKRGVVHRDIKHDNIVLSRDYSRVMVIDFGLAEYIKESPTPAQKFVPCGTMGFASPENIQAVVERKTAFSADGPTMHAADMFSLGVVAYMMLAGCKPLRGTRFAELHSEVKRGLRCQGARWGNASEDAKQLVEWLLHSQTKLRATPADVVQHAFVARNVASFTAIEVSRKEELEAEDNEEEDDWVFVGAFRMSSEWRLVSIEDEEIGKASPNSPTGSPSATPAKKENGGTAEDGDGEATSSSSPQAATAAAPTEGDEPAAVDL